MWSFPHFPTSLDGKSARSEVRGACRGVIMAAKMRASRAAGHGLHRNHGLENACQLRREHGPHATCTFAAKACLAPGVGTKGGYPSSIFPHSSLSQRSIEPSIQHVVHLHHRAPGLRRYNRLGRRRPRDRGSSRCYSHLSLPDAHCQQPALTLPFDIAQRPYVLCPAYVFMVHGRCLTFHALAAHVCGSFSSFPAPRTPQIATDR